MRLSKLLICSLLICALALPMALGESGEPVVTEAPTEKPTETPTQKPTEAPTEKPTEAPTTSPELPEVPGTGAQAAPFVAVILAIFGISGMSYFFVSNRREEE